jgi:hypothetical protein
LLDPKNLNLKNFIVCHNTLVLIFSVGNHQTLGNEDIIGGKLHPLMVKVIHFNGCIDKAVTFGI